MKGSDASQSDPLAALYQLLEPETAVAFRDECIEVDIDASQKQAAGIAQRMHAGLLKEWNLRASIRGWGM